MAITCYANDRVRSAHRIIPSFALYGENTPASATDTLHIEDIQSRSSKYLWRIATHRHLGLSQIIFLGAGPAETLLEDQRYECQAPALLVVPAGTVHSFRFAADTDGYVLTVDLERLLGATAPGTQRAAQGLFSTPRIIDLKHDPALAMRLGRLMYVLAAEFRQPDSVRSPVCGWLANSVLAVAAHGVSHESPAPGGNADLRVMRHFRELIETNLLRHWPVERYAAQLKLSGTTLNRLCQRLTGVTAFTLVQQRLALEARRRLLFVGGTVHGIAAELGFKDAAYFSRFFRRHCGLSPNAFRRAHTGG